MRCNIEKIASLMQSFLDHSTFGDNKSISENSSGNLEVIEAIYHLIEEWKSNTDLTEKLCIHLFGFYRSGDLDSKVFTLQFIPSLLFAYLNGIAQGDKKLVGCIQTLLLAIYNLEAGEEAQIPKTHSFRVPNLAQPSIYHEPLGLAPSALTESALKRLDPANRITVKFGPLPHLPNFNAENRLPAVAALLRIYLEHLNMYSSTSLAESCLSFTRLVAQGFTSQTEHSPRIPLSSQVLVEILRIIYSLTIEDGDLGTRAQQALEAVQNRVEVDLMPAPLLISSAIADAASLSIKGVSSTSQLVSTVSTAGARAQWKSMITNASFRTKKLPDDITVAHVPQPESTAQVSSSLLPVGGMTAPLPNSPASPSGRDALGPISEENDEPTTKSFRLPELSQLVKKKDKTKQPPELSSGKNKPVKQVKKSNNGISDHNGSDVNGVTIALNSSVDWNSSDGDSKDEMDPRRKSTEVNHTSTQV
nr:EOG090X02H3 [Sida crystallina]